jgi:hypothetical protein
MVSSAANPAPTATPISSPSAAVRPAEHQQRAEWDEELAGLLDQRDADRGEGAEGVLGVVLQDACGGGADDPAEQGGDGDGARADGAGEAAAVEEGEERGRDRGGAEQDQRRREVRVAGEYEGALDGQGRHHPGEQHGNPALHATDTSCAFALHFNRG